MTNLVEIPFRGQKWKVTPFHCIVGDMVRGVEHHGAAMIEAWGAFQAHWGDCARCTVPLHFDCYPTKIREKMVKLRNDRPFCLGFTNDPLIVNELQYEECTLASVENGKIILTNFTDLYGAEDAPKAFFPGEFWLSYCEGGAERNLRFGERNPKSRMG